MTDKIPCPVDGCDEEFDDEAAAIKHMKAEHLEEFTAHTGEGDTIEVEVGPVSSNENTDALAMVPPELLELMDKRMDARIKAAIEAERPQIAAAVKGAIEQVVAQARTAGIPIPGVTDNPGEGGAVPGSPVTPAGAELLKYIIGGGGGGGDLTSFIQQANQYKAIGELFNPPPSLADRIITSAYIKNLKKLDLVTDKAMQKLDKELFGDEP